MVSPINTYNNNNFKTRLKFSSHYYYLLRLFQRSKNEWNFKDLPSLVFGKMFKILFKTFKALSKLPTIPSTTIECHFLWTLVEHFQCTKSYVTFHFCVLEFSRYLRRHQDFTEHRLRSTGIGKPPNKFFLNSNEHFRIVFEVRA